MTYPVLRFCASLLIVLGWLSIIVSTLAGFLPWVLIALRLLEVGSRWEALVMYASPVVGLLTGVIIARGYFAVGYLLRIFLEQRDLLAELVTANQRLLRLVEPPSRESEPSGRGLFDVPDRPEPDEPTL